MPAKILAHDIRNYLSIMIHAVGLIEQSATDEAIVKAVECLKRSIKRINDACNHALGVDSAELSDLTSVLAECVSQYEGILKLNVASTPCETKVNKSRFSDVFTNILKNSEEAQATLVKVRLDKRYIIFEDNGCGFKTNAFQQESNKGAGHGFGLKSLRQFCLEHGFQLEIKNSTGGAIVFMRFKD